VYEHRARAFKLSRVIRIVLRRFLKILLRPLVRLALRLIPAGDPWERIKYAPGLALYGAGARREFESYFAGDSKVKVRSFDDVLRWLRGCKYASDEDMFQESDFWQHPRTFEHLKKGDCEDFALWAWRKMIELGIDADFVVGYRAPFDEGSRHAWIIYRRDGVEYLFEPCRKDRDLAIQPLADVKQNYIPELGVGPDKRRFAFVGYINQQQARQRKKEVPVLA